MRGSGLGAREKDVLIKKTSSRIPRPASYALLFLAGFSFLAHADQSEPQPPAVIDQYAGGFKDDYLQELSRVRTFLSLAQQNISTQLGLVQYGNGFYHPVVIRFDDGAPSISENPFFYINIIGRPSNIDQGFSPGDPYNAKDFRQELVANVEAYARKHREGTWKEPDLRNGFNYAMTQLILNDVTHGHGLPVWIQEGLAIYMSGSGESFIAETVENVPRSQTKALVEDLNRPHPYLSKRQWARYYLAIKYIFDTGGVNALQGFVRETVDGYSAADAVLHTLSLDWPTFQQNVKEYSLKTFQNTALSDDDPRIKNTAGPGTEINP